MKKKVKKRKRDLDKECVICKNKIIAEFGKLQGTIIKVRDENKKPQEISVCNECMRQPDWIEIAIIKGA